MSAPHTAPDRYNVTVYLDNGNVETHKNVNAARAKELEGVFGASETVMRIDVTRAET
jgi:hypothetical protein